jgi:very-short-patch-repair endonuclease
MGVLVSLEVQLQLAGLPAPLLDDFEHNPERKWRWDIAFPEQRLLVDVSGGNWKEGKHVRGKGYEADCAKWNDAVIHGYRVLIFTTDQVASGEALSLIKRALEATP